VLDFIELVPGPQSGERRSRTLGGVREVACSIKFRLHRLAWLASDSSAREAPGFVPEDQPFRGRHGLKNSSEFIQL